MRLEKKYKKFIHLNTLSSFENSRIFDFKNSKWKNLKKKSFRKITNVKKLENPFVSQVSVRSLEKIKSCYKQGLTLKTSLILLFHNSIKVSFLKKELVFNSKKSVKDLLLNCFIKPLFRLDILLTQLDFCKTPFSARQYINEGKILVNSKRIKSNYILKQGDIVSFKNKSLNFFFDNLQSKPKFKFYNFIEFDNYLKTIIVIKDLKLFTSQDINLIVQNFFDLNILKNYL